MQLLCDSFCFISVHQDIAVASPYDAIYFLPFNVVLSLCIAHTAVRRYGRTCATESRGDLFKRSGGGRRRGVGRILFHPVGWALGGASCVYIPPALLLHRQRSYSSIIRFKSFDAIAVGNASEEFLTVQTELSLAQTCVMGILGESGYGYMLRQHMCCGYPSAPRGSTWPRKCICPPTVHLKQNEFDCKEGNDLDCVKDRGVNLGGFTNKPLDDPANMLGANFSITRKAYRQNPTVWYRVFGGFSGEYKLDSLREDGNGSMVSVLKQHILEELRKRCSYFLKGERYQYNILNSRLAQGIDLLEYCK